MREYASCRIGYSKRKSCTTIENPTSPMEAAAQKILTFLDQLHFPLSYFFSTAELHSFYSDVPIIKSGNPLVKCSQKPSSIGGFTWGTRSDHLINSTLIKSYLCYFLIQKKVLFFCHAFVSLVGTTISTSSLKPESSFHVINLHLFCTCVSYKIARDILCSTGIFYFRGY